MPLKEGYMEAMFLQRLIKELFGTEQASVMYSKIKELRSWLIIQYSIIDQSIQVSSIVCIGSC
jgi:hypothetical protein